MCELPSSNPSYPAITTEVLHAFPQSVQAPNIVCVCVCARARVRAGGGFAHRRHVNISSVMHPTLKFSLQHITAGILIPAAKG